MRRSAENKLQVIAVRIDPVIEQRLRLLADTTGRKQSYFVQQLIERGLDAMEDQWLPSATVARIRRGELPLMKPTRPVASPTGDLFGDDPDQ